MNNRQNRLAKILAKIGLVKAAIVNRNSYNLVSFLAQNTQLSSGVTEQCGTLRQSMSLGPLSFFQIKFTS